MKTPLHNLKVHEYAVMTLSLITTLTLAGKHVLVFYPLALSSNVLFGLFCLRKKHYGIFITAVAAFLVNIYGLLNWAGYIR